MKRTWTVFLATLSLVCFSWGPFAPSTARGDFPPLAENLYQRAVQICPYGDFAEVQLLLPAAPQITAVTLAGDYAASGDYSWYPQASSGPSYEADPFIYGYEYDYDYSHGDYGYRALHSGSDQDENFESYYGYDANGRTLKPAPETAEELAATDGYEPFYGYDDHGRPLAKSYTLGYSAYDDHFADDFFRFAAPRSLSKRLADGVAALATTNLPAELAALAQQAADSEVVQETTAPLTLAWTEWAQQTKERFANYSDFVYSHFDAFAPAHHFFGDEAWVEEADELASDWESVRQLARSLDRAGTTLQSWSRLLNDYASHSEQRDTLQTRRPAGIKAR